MSQARAFRDNARFCAARAAEVTQSEQDRAAWMRLSLAWHGLADFREYADHAVHQRAVSGDAVSSADVSPSESKSIA